MERIKFTPHETCETPDTCWLLEMCQRALVIEDELINEKNFPRKSDLKKVIRNAKCNHPQVLVAIEKAREYLKSIQ